MRNKLILSLAVAATIAAGPAMAMNESDKGYTAPPAPEAADKTLGMALMSASVLAGCGSSFRGAGVESINEVATGICRVSFNRNVRDCTVVVSPGAFGTTEGLGSAQTNYVSGADNDNIVEVLTRNTDDDADVRSFHLIVFCSK